MMETTDYRILVTGWRFWSADKAWYVHEALSCVAIEALAAGYRHLVVVEGKCPKGGVDEFARDWAKAQPFADPETHPARWNRYGKAAGPLRNTKMVNLGANICLGFPGLGSTGTIDCMDKARAAGIQVIELPWIEATRMERDDEFFNDLWQRLRLPA